MATFEGSQSGAERLKALRVRRGLTQEDVLYEGLAIDGILTQANYSRIERGLSHPSREKLDAILDRLDAGFNDRQDITKYFGYVPPFPLPTDEEIAATIERCQSVLDSVPMPAYLMDFLTRFLVPNSLFSKLLGIHEGTGVLRALHKMPLFKAQFDSRVKMADYMKNMDAYLTAEMESIRERLTPYKNERWYPEFVEGLREEPEFNHYWQATQDTAPADSRVTAFAERALQTVQFNVPGIDTQLDFYANVDPLLDDNRFSIVYLIPAEPFTIRQVERWQAT